MSTKRILWRVRVVIVHGPTTTWRHYLMEQWPPGWVSEEDGQVTVQVLSTRQGCLNLSKSLAPIVTRVVSRTGGIWMSESLTHGPMFLAAEQGDTHLWIFFSCFSCTGFQSLIGGLVMGARMAGYPALKPPSNGRFAGPSRQIFPLRNALFSGASLVSALNFRTFWPTVHAMERASHQVLLLFTNSASR